MLRHFISFRGVVLSKFLLLIVFLSFADVSLAGSGCATGTSGAISGVVICAVDDGKSNAELVATGVIAIASVMCGLYVVTQAFKI